MFCINCGKEIPDGSAFCPGCGRQVGVPMPQQQAQTFNAGAAAGSAVNAAKSSAARAVDKINEMAGGSDHVDLKFGQFFDSVFKKHTRAESDELFACGGPTTTPALQNISKVWPHPWLYSRVLAVLLLTYAGLYILSSYFGNPNGFPGVMFIGALAVPFATVVFFFETNAPRNISFASVLEMFLVGGVFSILCIYPLSAIFPGSGTGDIIPALLTGIVEELAKAILVAFFMCRTKGRNYILSGLLIGAAVGAGFAVFETAGYIFTSFVETFFNTTVNNLSALTWDNWTALYAYGFQGMVGTVWARAVLAIGGHVAWAAVEGGALALCDEGAGFKIQHASSKKFLPFLGTCIVLHGIWDTAVPVLDEVAIAGFSVKYILLIVVIWVVLYVLLHRGIAQINELSAQPVVYAPAGQVVLSQENLPKD